MKANDYNKHYIDEYFKIKNQLALPIKIRAYFSFLESLLYQNNCQNVPKQMSKIFKLLKKSFIKLSLEEKGYFLKENVTYLKSFIANDRSSLTLIEQQSPINQIQTKCNIIQKFLGVCCSTSSTFKFNRKQYKIMIKHKKNQITIDLRQYYVRKSNKYKNALVLDAVSEAVQLKYHTFLLQFENLMIFHEIYTNIRNCIVTFTNRQISLLLNRQNEDNTEQIFVTHMDHVDKSLIILTKQKINLFFQVKQKIANKLKKQKIQLKTFQQLQNGILSIGTFSNNQKFYKLEKRVNIPLNQMKQQIFLFNKKANGNLLEFEILEKFTQTIQLSYFKYLFQKQKKINEFLVICQEIIQEQQIKIVIQGTANLTINKAIEYLQIKITKVSEQQTNIYLLGMIKFQSQLNKNINTDFIKEIVGLVTRNIDNNAQKRQSTADDDDDFRSVKGDYLQSFCGYVSFENNACNQFEQICFYDIPQGSTIIVKNQQQQIIVIDQQDEQPNLDEQNLSSSQSKQLINQLQTFHTHRYVLKPLNKQQLLQINKIQEHFLLSDFERAKNGGVICINKEKIAEQKKVFKRILAQMGDNIFKAKNIMNISLPVQIFKKQSLLKTQARNLSYAPILLDDYINSSPIQRMKRVIALSISIDCVGISMQKPFNPILGQTYQGYIDGCPIYLEQISHHPPISAVLLIGRGYTISGHFQTKISLGLNCIIGQARRYLLIKFEDGLQFNFKPGTMIINGMMFGERLFTFEGKNKIMNKQHGLYAQINYGPRNNSYFSHSGEKVDYIYGEIYEIKKQSFSKCQQITKISNNKELINKKICDFEGHWDQILKFDNKEIINFVKDLPSILTQQSVPIPSNSLYRQDLKYLVANDMNLSQHWKDELQQIQRKDKKNRQKNSK